MKGRLAVFLGATCALSSLAYADDYIPPVIGGHTYVQHQIVTAKSQHPEIASILVEGVREGSDKVVVLGSTVSAATVFSTVSHPTMPMAGTWSRDHHNYVVRSAYNSNTGHPIGTIIVTFRSTRGSSPGKFDALANRIVAQMTRVTLSPKNASDPWPYDVKYGPTTYAQALTEKFTAAHPDLLVMMIHATPPGGTKNIIIGSNIGRFGKEADEDDARVIDKGSTNLEVGGDKDRFETELPLNNATGKRIGALGLVFPLKAGENQEAIHRHGLAIRDELAREIPTSAALFRQR